MHSGRVITPVFDSTGMAINFFKATAASIVNQDCQNFEWIVSVQFGTVPWYLDFLKSLKISNLTIRTSKATTLQDHLNELLHMRNNADWTHILCQDDFYLRRFSTHDIEKALTRSDVVILRPDSRCGQDTQLRSLMSEKLGRTKLFLSTVPVNRIGGLSTLAWRSKDMEPLKCAYSLLADVDLIDQLRQKNSSFVVLLGILAEAHWSGQAQFALSSNQESEFSQWVRAHPSSRCNASLSAIAADIYGYRNLGDAWEGSAGILISPLRRLSRFLGRVRSSWYRLSSLTKTAGNKS